ncbi:MAG TPA: hypothetical protein PLE48_14775 [Thiobacillus sp.]|uniref:hypothetical protein n=1 Tax=unclassified Acidovorax TaxID=2684926 RepID=UPI0025BD84B1|nr:MULTISPECIES: hypothetical protein [unclassified Acidovorax]HQS64729.1 hypothetical protein [Acidovorax defluvii]HQT71669.1 hypothetical protein [Thiobacillus sp.]
MTGGEEEPKKGEGKGFAGLSSLVSDVDTSSPPPPVPKKEPAAAVPSAGRPGLQPAQPQPQPSQQRQTYQEPAQPPSGDSLGGKWLLGVVVVFGVLFWLFGLSNKNEDSSSLTNATTIQAQKNSRGGTPNKTEESVAPKFGDYSSEFYSGQRAKVNLLTDFDKNFKTRIRRTQAESINFAGEYILATWGCGMDCLMGVAVSARTGQVIELPGTACCWKSAGEKIIFKKNSRLLVLAGLINETGQHGAHFYELKNNEFFHVKTIPVKEDEPSDNSATLAPVPSNQNAASAYSPTPGLPQQSASPAEDKPPIGSSLVLSTAQIRYCLGEDIRMEAAKAVVNSYSDGDVDRFNAMVADYNSRCGSFRYRSGALEGARRDIEPYRSQFQSEGRSKFARPSTGSLSTPAPAPARSNPSTAVFSAQSHAAPGLESLTYDEKDAIETACILKRSEGAASYNRCVSSQLNALASAPRTPDLSRLSYDEKDAIETACILKRSEGAATYNRCLTSQLGALANAPRKPDLSGLAYDEKDAIETACILKRSEGAASYNRCLVAQLGALANAPRLPSLSGLAYDEKDAIETACILKRSEGAASYNRCVVAQLRALGR